MNDEDHRSELTTRLVNLRKSQGITQQDMADAWGVNQSTVSEFEAEGRDHRLSTIQRYARTLGLRVQVLLIPTEGKQE